MMSSSTRLDLTDLTGTFDLLPEAASHFPSRLAPALSVPFQKHNLCSLFRSCGTELDIDFNVIRF